MFLWPIALQYFIYTICILLIDHQIVHKCLFFIVTCLNAILLSFLYPIFGIFSTLIAIFMLAMIFHFLSSSHRPLVYALTLGLLSSLLGDHLASIGDFIVLGSSMIEPGDASQYFHIALSALLSFILAYSFRKALDNWSYAIDYQIIGTIGVFIFSTYYIIILYTRFSGGNPEVLALNTTFIILYLCIGLIIFIYYWKISNAKCEDDPKQLEMITTVIKNRIMIENLGCYIHFVTSNSQDLLTSVQINTSPFGIYFLDIELKDSELNGIELGKKIRDLDPSGKIIYVTSYTDLSLIILKNNIEPTDYIIKEDILHLKDNIERILSKLFKDLQIAPLEKEMFKIEFNDEIKFLPIKDIQYFSTSPGVPHKLEVHLPYSQLQFYGNIKEIEDRNHHFIRCH